MKFAFISTMHDWTWGGSEELWSQAAVRLRLDGNEVYASVGYWPRLSEKVTGLTRYGVRLETHPSRQAGQTLRIWNKISGRERRGFRRLLRFRPDLVVISQGHNSGGFEWARACRSASVPYIVIVHCNSEFWWFQDQLSDAELCYTEARRVFCVSNHNLELLCRQLGRDLPNAGIVHNPCNVSMDQPPEWPEENGEWRLACVARIDPAAKGQDLLLQVLARPEWRNRPVKLGFFGAGSDQAALRKLVGMLELKNVQFYGHVPDSRAIWEQNHLLVLPSRYEGLPLALVEAMWCGRPAVVTDVGGNAEMCMDGKTGFVAGAATVSSFADAMECAWRRRGEWARLGRAARLRAGEIIPRDPVGLFCDQLRACVTPHRF